jgi:predicted RNase H-like HicB family nuclease
VKAERKLTVLIERDEDGYFVATVPSLRGCHTQAKSLDTLMKRVREVIALCLGKTIATQGRWNWSGFSN